MARASKQASKSAIENPRYAAIVVDALNGATLRQANADSLRHPASLTKIMTLYMLFERLESGKLKLTTPLPVSVEAASQAPTKLGLKPGATITVDDAIKALVTKSANDIAVVVAEALAGSEEEFARQMTRKARTLGMTRTVYRNASGLPDDEQVTTARDQARLGVLIQERFPRYYRYFATVSFSFHGETMRNHNHLLGHVAGIDGIKTGYTAASGYNLVTSVRRGARHIVAVVLGGDTASRRDAQMRDLIERHIVEASIKRPEVQVAQGPQAKEALEARAEARPEPKAEKLAAARPESRTEPPSAPRFMPHIVIVPIVPAPTETASPIVPPAQATMSAPTSIKTVPIRAAALPIPNLNAYAPAPEIGSAALESSPLRGPADARPLEDETSPAVTGNIGPQIADTGPRRTGWSVQVGAFDQEDEARQRLNMARSKATDLLAAAEPYTERTSRGDKALYRARFGGLDRTQADSVCKILHRSDVACIAIKN